jgi:import inner membrane translocase subunit TIM54
MVNGKRHGDVARRIADEIKARRRLDLGLDVPIVPPMPLPTRKSPEETHQHELEGGIVIVGRHTFKEFMVGLKRGWTGDLEKVDRDELLARELESDGQFDEPDELVVDPPPPENSVTPSSRTPSPKDSPVFSPLRNIRQTPAQAVRQTQHPPQVPYWTENPPIPPLPPLLLVSFTNYIGFTQIPLMIWDFFNQRHKVHAGAEAAYRLIKKEIRPFQVAATTSDANAYSDLDFDRDAESYYKKSLSSIPADIEQARKKYYDALPAKLETARAISRGTREMTKEERNYPPPTEVELRTERMNKEKRWRNDLEGWEIVKPEQEVAWDDKFADALQVFVDPRND